MLILAPYEDAEARLVAEALRDQSVRVEQIGVAELCGSIGASVRVGPTGPELWVTSATGRAGLNEVAAVWNRRPLTVLTPASKADDAGFATREAQHYLLGMGYLLEQAHWVNPHGAQMRASHKPYQLAMAQRCGLRVPKTLFTNEPDRAAEFWDECKGAMIYKPLTFLCREAGSAPPHTIFTNRVSPSELRSRRDQISAAPCIFQEMVPKRLEQRVTVIGDELFVATIDATSSPTGGLDWRHYDMSKTKFSKGTVRPDTAGAIRALMAQLGLAFGCIDLVVTPEGQTVFLEINPAGQFLWLERLTGLPLLAAFTAFLARRGEAAAAGQA